MTRLVAVGLVAIVGLGSPAPAMAYLKFGVRVGGSVINIRWSQPISYFVTDRPVAEVSSAELRDAVTRAFGTWQGVPTGTVRAAFAGFTTAPPGLQDGRSTFGFLDRPDLDRVLAATSFLLDASTGTIVESDVFFNTRFTWSTAAAGQAGRVDLESVALHEIGHLLGLGHSALGETEISGSGRRVVGSGSIMFPIAMSPGATADRQLQRDDIAGIGDLYPAASFASAGSISGRVTKNGQGVYGAHVVAYNLETGALVGNYTLDQNGEFVIAGLDPGRHVVRVEPLDDADVESFLTGPVDVDFRVAFGTRLVTTAAGGGSETIEIAVRPK